MPIQPDLKFAGAPVNGVNEVQTLTVTGTPTGGNTAATVTHNGVAAAATVLFNSTAAQATTAFEALATVGAGNVLCGGGPLPGTPITIAFQGQLAGLNMAAITLVDAYTGGASPEGAITTPTAGVKGTYRGAPTGSVLEDTTNGAYHKQNGAPVKPLWIELTWPTS